LEEGSGFDAARLAVMELDPMRHGYDAHRARELARALVEALGRRGDVRAASAVTRAPFFVGANDFVPVSLDGRDCADPSAACPLTGRYGVDDRYFEAMGITLLAGRAVTTQQPGDSQSVVVSATAAARFWPNADPLGRSFRLDPGGWFTVVGVAADVAHRGLGDAAPPYLYLAMTPAHFRDRFAIVARAADQPEALVRIMREALRRIDPDLPPQLMQTMRERMALPLWLPRTTTGFFGVCASVAVFLSTLGLFGVTYVTVTQRAREFGLRVALGATPRAVRQHVLREAMRVVAPGIGFGVLLGILVSVAARSGVVGLQTAGAWPYVAAAGVQLIAVLVASWAPAQRACRASPLDVLR
jgi:hypothetical protein